jgi:hypothetical protein
MHAIRRYATALGIGGLLALAALALSFSAGPASAQTQDPPPRPTLTPAPALTPTPAQRAPHRQDQPQAPAGRITGTVIDEATGAPMPGVMVVVGDTTVTTDANGNYDRSGLPAGSYWVALAEGQGAVSQDAATVALDAGATVVHHLLFRRPLPATPTPSGPAPARLPTTGAAGTPGGPAWAAIGVMIVAGLLFRRWSGRERSR